jgi:hypothetical protein
LLAQAIPSSREKTAKIAISAGKKKQARKVICADWLLPAGHGLGVRRHESRRNPSSPWTPLLQGASEFAAVPAGSPCCQLVMDLGFGDSSGPWSRRKRAPTGARSRRARRRSAGRWVLQHRTSWGT